MLHIAPSTLRNWRVAGIVVGHRPNPRGHYRYPADQPTIAAALTGGQA